MSGSGICASVVPDTRPKEIGDARAEPCVRGAERFWRGAEEVVGSGRPGEEVVRGSSWEGSGGGCGLLG